MTRRPHRKLPVGVVERALATGGTGRAVLVEWTRVSAPRVQQPPVVSTLQATPGQTL